VTGCCDPSGYADVFGGRFARAQVRRYRKRGLDRTAQRLVDFLAGRGVEGASVLEIGGGVGEIQLELLRRGAARTTNLELVSEYDAPASQLATAEGVADRVERRIVDIATAPDEVDDADVVVLHRVVCCYPDYERLLRAAADHARHALVLSYPHPTLANRAVIGVENAWHRLRGNSFRAFTHSPDDMLRVLHSAGLRTSYQHHGRIWHVAGLERPTAREAA
jgi:magnesium-protoporphyrin O-methyltransferase